MKVFVFKPSNEFIGKFDIDNLNSISTEFEKFSRSKEIGTNSYLECSGKTWTLVPGANGLELQEGKRQKSSSAGVASSVAPEYPSVEKSNLAFALSIIAVLQLIAAPVAGFLVGQESQPLGWTIFLTGLISGLILLGFAKVIEHLYECAQRLRHVDGFLQKSND
jgi:hypothetical protein